MSSYLSFNILVGQIYLIFKIYLFMHLSQLIKTVVLLQFCQIPKYNILQLLQIIKSPMTVPDLVVSQYLQLSLKMPASINISCKFLTIVVMIMMNYRLPLSLVC